jgi:hypothetical protein
MMNLLQASPWHEVGANIATILGLVGIVFLINEYNSNKGLRNLQLMGRCIDSYKEWLKTGKVNQEYLELLGEELFYFQRGLLDKRVAIEWIQGIIDMIQIQGEKGEVLNNYNQQTNLESLPGWEKKAAYYARINYFIHPSLKKNIVIPGPGDPYHYDKKRELAIQLYKHIKTYKY